MINAENSNLLSCFLPKQLLFSTATKEAAKMRLIGKQ